jgi:fatty-acyl-CoA synthase
MPQAHKIKFVTELPINGVGKVDKKVLKAGFWVGRGRMVRIAN